MKKNKMISNNMNNAFWFAHVSLGKLGKISHLLAWELSCRAAVEMKLDIKDVSPAATEQEIY